MRFFTSISFFANRPRTNSSQFVNLHFGWFATEKVRFNGNVQNSSGSRGSSTYYTRLARSISPPDYPTLFLIWLTSITLIANLLSSFNIEQVTMNWSLGITAIISFICVSSVRFIFNIGGASYTCIGWRVSECKKELASIP